MKRTRVLVAHNAGLKTFETNGLGYGLRFSSEVAFENGRLHNSEIDTDRPGRTFSSTGSRHAYEPKQDAHEHAIEHFVRTIVRDLGRELHAGAFQKLVLVAPPRLLGMLKGALDTQLQKALIGSVPKDLPLADERELAEHIGHLVHC